MRLDQTETGEGGAQLTGGAVADWSTRLVTHTRTGLDSGGRTNPFRFGGQYFDSESGFYYLRARYYDSATAQFISVDPLEGSTRQPYYYVGGNPLNAMDPGGLSQQSDNPNAWTVAQDVWGVVTSTTDAVGKALSRSATVLSAGLRAGCSFAGRWLRPVSKLSRAFEDVPGLGEISIAASIGFGALAGESPMEIAGGTIGGVVGGVVGGALVGTVGCALGALTTIGDALICPASIAVGAVAGGYLGGLAGAWLGKSANQGSWAPWSWV